MKQKFKSEAGLALILAIAGAFAIVLSIGFVNGHLWSTLGIVSPIIVFIAPMILATSYTINGNHLEIRSGFFYYKKIRIDQILQIRSSNSWRNSPASSFSFDRLELFYTKYDNVLISPKDKQRFIDELLKIAPSIDVDLKTT